MEDSNKMITEIVRTVVKNVDMLQIEIPLQIRIQKDIEKILQNYVIKDVNYKRYQSDIGDKVQKFLHSKNIDDGLSKDSLYNYELVLLKLSYAVNKPVSLITIEDLRIFISDMYGNNTQISKNNKITCIKSFFTWLQNEGYILQNPAIKLKSIRVPHKERRSLTSQEVIQMRKSCITLREHTVFELLLSTGIRVSELCDIKVKDVDFVERTILIHGKGNKERIVFFDSKTKRWLIKYIGNKPETCHDFLFVSKKYPYNNVSKCTIEDEIKTILNRTNIDKICTAHVLRHTFATIAVNNDMPLPVLQKLLGHNSLETTQIYYDINKSKIKKEYQKLNI